MIYPKLRPAMSDVAHCKYPIPAYVSSSDRTRKVPQRFNTYCVKTPFGKQKEPQNPRQNAFFCSLANGLSVAFLQSMDGNHSIAMRKE